jgi:hypothetical protein
MMMMSLITLIMKLVTHPMQCHHPDPLQDTPSQYRENFHLLAEEISFTLSCNLVKEAIYHRQNELISTKSTEALLSEILQCSPPPGDHPESTWRGPPRIVQLGAATNRSSAKGPQLQDISSIDHSLGQDDDLVIGTSFEVVF